MRPENVFVIAKIPIIDVSSARADPDVPAFAENASQKLGDRGRFVIKFSGIPQENSVLAEGNSREACDQCIEDFKKLLIRKGYMKYRSF